MEEQERHENADFLERRLKEMGTAFGCGPITKDNAQQILPKLGKEYRDKAHEWLLAKIYMRELKWVK